MSAMFELIERVATSNIPVLVRGESGTGKELVARTIHQLSPRKHRPFVAVNCTTLPESILESELFGHVRGAFTGATVSRRGLFVEADGGSLFLDEIGDMPAPLQAKLLRVLEDGEIRSVGADTMRKVDVRVIAATHQDLEKRVQEDLFRADLFYRLNVLPIEVPLLRDRIEDIPLLIEHFLNRAREANPHCVAQKFSPKSIALLSSHPWPGNVRELENIVKRLVLVCTKEVIEPSDIKLHAQLSSLSNFTFQRPRERLIPLRQMEEEYISWVIDQCDGNKTRAAEILVIDVSTIHRREKRT